MLSAEFEEAGYEAPLYNQIERGATHVYTPGRVLESRLGFDRGILVAEHAVWETLGYSMPPPGIALGYYDWPPFWGPRQHSHRLPRFRLNIFIQAKRSIYCTRQPRILRHLPHFSAPMWKFAIKPQQQKLLECLAKRAGRRAHVAYAAPAFHTESALFGHIQKRTIVANSTFPSVAALKRHEAWYYRRPGAEGIANPNPEPINELGFIDRLNALASDAQIPDEGDLFGFERIAEDVIGAVGETEEFIDSLAAKFMNDLQTLERLIEPFDLRPTLRAYAQVRLFALQYRITWLIHGDQR